MPSCYAAGMPEGETRDQRPRCGGADRLCVRLAADCTRKVLPIAVDKPGRQEIFFSRTVSMGGQPASVRQVMMSHGTRMLADRSCGTNGRSGKLHPRSKS
jgi:hypothetical protein